MESAIPKIAEMRITYIMDDFSGRLTKNLEVLNLFQQMGCILRLMGLKVVNTEIGLDLVQTIVRSGIRLSNKNSFAAVKQVFGKLPYVKET